MMADRIYAEDYMIPYWDHEKNRSLRSLKCEFVREKAEELKKHMTATECVVWAYLENGFATVKWESQKPMFGKYIVDFYSVKARTIIEIDGKHHINGERRLWDLNRDDFFWGKKIQTLRYQNDEVTGNIKKVMANIKYNVEYVLSK